MDDTEGPKLGETEIGSPKAPDNSSDLAHRENVAGALERAQISTGNRAVEIAGEKDGLKGALASRKDHYINLLKGRPIGRVKGLSGPFAPLMAGIDSTAVTMWNYGARLPLATVDKARTALVSRLSRPKTPEAVPPPKS